MKEFNKEQIAKINSLSKLPAEQQNIELQKFLKTLDKEQAEFLMKQEKQQCVFCLIKEGKIKSRKIYEDNQFIAVLDINPANIGHAIVFPKEHVSSVFQLKGNIFDLTNKLALKISNAVNAQGLNIFIANGAVAGQKVDHIAVHIIPRFENDNIELSWEPKKISNEDMNKVESVLKESVKDISSEEKKEVKEEKKVYTLRRKIP